MCTTPLMINGYEVSCRECDQCLATYKNTWVSRCVAEKQVMPYAYAITLTYADIYTLVGGEYVKHPPLGARVFRYKDVSDFWKRIRAAGKRKWGENIEFRYVIVGEIGTENGRCHYHGVIFSSHPIVELGKLTSAKGGGFAYKRRLDWTVWNHGFVQFQVADRAGMSYALKYILKARMTAERSRGYAREGKTEWLASSYLWCSKTPPIGAAWLWQKLKELTDQGLTPPALRVRVPGGGDWYVGGKLQKEMCLYLHQANKEYRQARGRDLAGWSSLIKSVSDEIELADTGEIVQRKPLEWLLNGEEQEKNTEYTEYQKKQDWDKYKVEYARKRRIAAPITAARATLRKCGHILPCEACSNTLNYKSLEELNGEYKFRLATWRAKNPQGSRQSDVEWEERFKEWWLTRLRPSRGCGLRDADILQEQFARLVPVTKAQPGLAAKAAVGGALHKKAGQCEGP